MYHLEVMGSVTLRVYVDAMEFLESVWFHFWTVID